MSSAAQALRRARHELNAVAGEESAQQANLLVAHILGCAPGELLLKRELPLSAEQSAQLDALLARRKRGEPLQYLLGEWGFMGLTFAVNPGALIPRQDTETLCEHALRLAKERGYETALDLCCGTGCIGIVMAKLGGLKVTCSDLSPDCVALAQKNTEKNGVPAAVLQGSFFAPVSGRFDMILSNPPYLTAADMRSLQREVAFEPELALYGGEDGLFAYREIALGYENHLNDGGVLLLEVGAGQARDVSALFYGRRTECIFDYNGVARVVQVEAR
ncbi:MAG TPA: peptide chain release factor N(5)-glutamine methyltransferase [Feifaniaceae bacterium]|nr:peptide chain release factor N(5)-glutamine methyltransferase [Feifaniaceae bacterium]